MIKSLIRIGALGLVAAAVTLPSQAPAQTTNKPATTKKSAGDTNESAKGEKKPGAGPFHGKLAAVDKVAKTITVGKRTFQITSETRIKKSGKPATLEDGVVGEPVSGYVKPGAEGKLIATTVNFGPKPSGESSDKKKATDQKESK